MRLFKNPFANLFTNPTRATEKIYKEWDRQRAMAKSPSEVSEIDAIFSRSI